MKIALFIFLICLLIACSDSNTDPIPTINYTSEGKAALVMVVENSDRANQQLEDIAFSSYPIETRNVFSRVFDVPVDSLYNKDLNQILDQYGEPWQIEQITKAAKSYYDTICVFTDEHATAGNVLDELTNLSQRGLNIDLVFSLHGSESNIMFNNQSVSIESFTNTIANQNLPIRVLYQTNCKSAKALDKWTNTKLSGCNGTLENNYLTIFAPINFVKNWVKGYTYLRAVESAYDEEIATLKTYNDELPILDYITTGNYLSGSLPIVSGLNITITKDHYYPTNHITN